MKRKPTKRVVSGTSLWITTECREKLRLLVGECRPRPSATAMIEMLIDDELRRRGITEDKE